MVEKTVSKSLVIKLCEVMDAVSRVPKRGRNKFHGYDYATESDVSDAIRKALADHHVFMLPSIESVEQREVTTRKGGVETVSRARIKYTFLDGDSDETLEFYMEGEGQDAGDKSIYKAITGTGKYAILKPFLIPTGDDPEGDSGVDERMKDREARQRPVQAPEPKQQYSAKRPDIAALNKALESARVAINREELRTHWRVAKAACGDDADTWQDVKTELEDIAASLPQEETA